MTCFTFYYLFNCLDCSFKVGVRKLNQAKTINPRHSDESRDPVKRMALVTITQFTNHMASKSLDSVFRRNDGIFVKLSYLILSYLI